MTKLKTPLKTITTYAFVFVLLACFSLLGFGGVVPLAQATEGENAYEEGYYTERIYSTSLDFFIDDNILSDLQLSYYDCDNELLFPNGNPYDINSRSEPSVLFRTERVNFVHRTQSGFVNPYEVPLLLSGIHCGVTAGSIAIAYFQKWMPQLIPGHNAGFYFLNRWIWGGHSPQIANMFSELFAFMGGHPLGVTVQEYLIGMQHFTHSRGRNIILQSIRTGNHQLNETALKAAFRSGHLVTLFVAPRFSIVPFNSIQTLAGHDLISHTIITANHVMMAYGYRRVRYYNASNHLIRTNLYLYVNTGFFTLVPRLALVPISSFTTLSGAFITHIW